MTDETILSNNRPPSLHGRWQRVPLLLLFMAGLAGCGSQQAVAACPIVAKEAPSYSLTSGTKILLAFIWRPQKVITVRNITGPEGKTFDLLAKDPKLGTGTVMALDPNCTFPQVVTTLQQNGFQDFNIQQGQ